MPLATQTHRCDTCGLSLPLTKSFFDAKTDSATGFRNTCKTCRKQDSLTVRNDGNERIDAFAKSADLALLGRAGELLKIGEGTSVPHVAEVYESIMAAFGGPAGYAAQIMSTYLAAAPGSGTRQRVLTLIAKMAKDTSESGKATIRLDLLTDEELEAECMGRLVAIVKQKPDLVRQMLADQHGGRIPGSAR